MYRKRILFFSLFLLCFLTWYQVFREFSRPLEIIFFDVGGGDAAFISFPEGGNILVDGGGTGKGERIILPFLKKRGIRKLDAIILTNPGIHRLGGLIEVIKRIEVKLILLNGHQAVSEMHREFLNIARETNIRTVAIRRGDKLLGFGEVNLDFLNPPFYLYEGTGSDIRNNSVVLRISYRGVKFLFSSDIESFAQKDIARVYKSALKVNLLKSGSGSAPNFDFLKEVSPEVTVISTARAGAGSFARYSVEKYEKAGSVVYPLDEYGAITVRMHGEGIELNTMRQAP